MAEFSQDWAQSFHLGTNLKEGAYVSLQVKDNGSGIPGEGLAAYSTHFSTKSTGRVRPGGCHWRSQKYDGAVCNLANKVPHLHRLPATKPRMKPSSRAKQRALHE